MQEQSAAEEPGFRIGGPSAGTPAKSGLEVVHLLHGLGPPPELEHGSSGVVPHPGAGGRQAGPGGFAAAAKAEHSTEADLLRRLLLSRGGGH